MTQKRALTESELDAMLMTMRTQVQFITDTTIEVVNKFSGTGLMPEAVASLAVNTYMHMAEPVFHVADCEAHEHDHGDPANIFSAIFGDSRIVGMPNPDGSSMGNRPPEQEKEQDDDSDAGDGES